jgi:serine phosphatase RsbU (regulator of sigma subunit)
MTAAARRWPAAHRELLVAVAAVLALAAALAWITHVAVRNQESRLVKERAAEVALVLNQSVAAIPADLQQQGAVLKATGDSKQAYLDDATEAVAAGPGQLTFAWLKPSQNGFVVVAAAGDSLHTGDVVTDARATAMQQALRQPNMVPTTVVGSARELGFALGPPAAPAGSVLYRESALGPAVSPPRAASSAPFSELDVALYAGPGRATSNVLVATTSALPLHGGVRTTVLTVGTAQWLLDVRARRPLVGTLTTISPWLILAGGLVVALLAAIATESTRRRREAALRLYRAERDIAETLQRSLLPELPSVDGLQLAARYLAGGAAQQVGGDWFDAFPLDSGATGLVVGDVVGHDAVAAAVMAQLRAVLRACAVDGSGPAASMTRFHHLVETLQVTPFVTVFYAQLDAPAHDGSRLLHYSNAGHPPPMVRLPDGSVVELADAASVVIGAPHHSAYDEAALRLPQGATLVLYTDGLIEVPGESLTSGLATLRDQIAAAPTDDLDDLLDHLLDDVRARQLRDDVVLMVVRIGAGAPPPLQSAAPSMPQPVLG